MKDKQIQPGVVDSSLKEEIVEVETPEHLVTVLSCWLEDGMTDATYKQATDYVKDWVEYRSEHVFSLKHKLHTIVQDRVDAMNTISGEGFITPNMRDFAKTVLNDIMMTLGLLR